MVRESSPASKGVPPPEVSEVVPGKVPSKAEKKAKAIDAEVVLPNEAFDTPPSVKQAEVAAATKAAAVEAKKAELDAAANAPKPASGPTVRFHDGGMPSVGQQMPKAPTSAPEKAPEAEASVAPEQVGVDPTPDTTAKEAGPEVLEGEVVNKIDDKRKPGSVREFLDEAAKNTVLGKLKKVGSILTRPFVATAEATDGFVAFQAERVKSYGKLIATQFVENRHGARFEKHKVEYNIASKEVDSIKETLGELKTRTEGETDIAPRDAARIEKLRRKLERDLVKAETAKDDMLRRVKYREGFVIQSENKKQLIAEQFTHLVNERLSPHKEKFEDLNSRKEVLEQEIGAWRERVENQTIELNKIKEKAKDNPYLKDTFKARIKAAEAQINLSRNELIERSKGVLGLDKKLIKVGNKLEKWNVKKDAYTRYAQDRIETFNPEEPTETQTSEGYRNPQASRITREGKKVTSTEAQVGQQAEAVPESAPETPDDTVEPVTEEREAFVAPAGFEFEEWATAWNKLYASKVQVSMQQMFDPAIVESHKRHHILANQKQFATLMRNFHKSLNTPDKKKISEKEFDTMSAAVFRTMVAEEKQKFEAGEREAA